MAAYRIAGRELACHHCDAGDFVEREVMLNTSGLSFFDLDWLNKSATGLICQACGFVHHFAKREAIEELP